MLNAAGLASPAGCVLALVAPAGMGKTTAAAKLCTKDFGYVTDELLCIDDQNHVFSFPKPLSCRRSGKESTKEMVSPEKLGLKPAATTLTLAGLVFLDRSPRPTPPRLKKLSLIDSLWLLIPEIYSLTSHHNALQTLCQLVTNAGAAHRLSYSEIEEAAPLLRKLITESTGVVPWKALTGNPGGDGPIRQSHIQDGIAADHEALLLIDDKPIRLDQLGLVLWEAATEGTSKEQLLAAAEESFGVHPLHPKEVEKAVANLLKLGVLKQASS